MDGDRVRGIMNPLDGIAGGAMNPLDGMGGVLNPLEHWSDVSDSGYGATKDHQYQSIHQVFY